jgi:hypothetical protein
MKVNVLNYIEREKSSSWLVGDTKYYIVGVKKRRLHFWKLQQCMVHKSVACFTSVYRNHVAFCITSGAPRWEHSIDVRSNCCLRFKFQAYRLLPPDPAHLPEEDDRFYRRWKQLVSE